MPNLTEIKSRFARYVEAFGKLMTEKLEKNAHKGCWEDQDPDYLFQRLKEEVKELTDEAYAKNNYDSKKVLREAADVANFALIIASNCLRAQGKDLIEDDTWTYHGQWVDGNRVLGLMYSNQFGEITYEDTPAAREKGLRICPAGKAG